jgi:hypothetical protein
MIILYCLLTTLNTNQIPLNKQLKTTQFWDREVRLIKKKKKHSQLHGSSGTLHPSSDLHVSTPIHN